MDKLNVTIFDNINGEIKKRGISEDVLCKNVGIDRRKYSYWEKEGDMPIPIFIKCACFLGCSLDYLARNVIE